MFKRGSVKIELVDLDYRVLSREQILLFLEVVKAAWMAAVHVGGVVSYATVFRAKYFLTFAPTRALFDEVEFSVTDKASGF